MNAIGACAQSLQHHLNDIIQSEVAAANQKIAQAAQPVAAKS
jgi:hypothetical protein